MTTLKNEDGTPIWVDLGTSDVGGAAAFYGGLFGWTFEDMGPQAGGYGIFRTEGRQVAGVGPATDSSRGTSWATYFQGNPDEVGSRVAANGGQVLVPPMDVLDQGRLGVFVDPEGAVFSVWQAGRHAGAEVVDEPGSLTWNELMTSDVLEARTFYAPVLGVGERAMPMGDGVDYTVLTTAGRAVAGAMQIDPSWGPTPTRWEVYFAVEDCDATFDRALSLGGTAGSAPADSPAGRFAGINDPQGGRFSIIKNDPSFSM